ncbi:hypothetical protein [Streptomyces himastatinicus]|nr:hypothetical protein [Streptomyces himastatinicus]
MADDHRYSWLDDKAAERLLRGEPVDGQHDAPDSRSDRPRAEAERLAAVLGAVAEAGRRTDGAAANGTAPLPGEEAAVAAFRAARTKPSVVAISAEDQVGGKSTRIARPDDSAPPRTGWRGVRRPLRAGMVAAVAGCALSGFAVAAAAGVLPFGQSGGTPGPDTSVTDTGPGSGESARPEISEDDGSPDPHAPGTSEGAQGRGVPGGGDGKGKHGKDGKRDRHDKPGKQGKGPKAGAWKSGTGIGPDNGTGQRALGSCRRYLAAEAGTGPGLGPKGMQKLTRAAGSRSAIHDYCVQLVGHDPVPRSGTEDTGTSAGTGGDGGSSDPAPPPPSGDDSGTPSPDPTSSSDTPSTLSGTPSGGSDETSSKSSSKGSSAEPSDSATPSADPATPTKSGAS